ncbi:mucoidy inhibitor MuiA family protein [Flavobacterium sp.]|uniref:mucoidy inhibitor MuiA family protein n=1 Tax=Flavobacterium sp. TaxID=239 RepID=UPI00404853DF
MNVQKRVVFGIVFSILVVFSSFSQQKTKNVISKINNVIVFTEGAQITRNGKTTLESGKTELVFSGVSPRIDKQSLQVKGSGNFTILSVVHQNNFLKEQENRSEIEKLEASKKSLEQNKTTETNILAILQNEENILAKNQVIGGVNSGLKAIELKEAVDFHRQRLVDLIKQKTEINERVATIDSDLIKLNKQLKALNQSDEKATSDIVVTVSASSSVTNAKFEIDYYVFNAGWFSNYDLRVEDVNSPIDLLLKANIFQSSGEDWKDVNLSISSGNPTESGVSPTINPWFLNLNSHRSTGGSVQAYGQLIGNTVSGKISDSYGPLPGASVMVKGTSIGAQADFDGNYSIKVPHVNCELVFSYISMKSQIVQVRNNTINVVLEHDVAQLEAVVVTAYSRKKSRKKEEDEFKSQPLETSVNYQPTTITYDIDVPYTVLNDGKVYTAEIKKFNLPADYQYMAVPKLDKNAYLTAKITDWQDLNLFDGELNLFFEGAFLGKSLLDLQNASDTLEISLGKDKGIAIERKQLKEYKSKQFLSSNKTESRAFEIAVKNNKPYAVAITILDQLPISTTKEITVFDEEYNEGVMNEETKLVTWKLKLPSKSEKKLNLKYKVKSPKNASLILD